MKKFVYQLQSLLNLKEEEKKNKLREYGQSIQNRLDQEKVCLGIAKAIEDIGNNHDGEKCLIPSERINLWNTLLNLEEKLSSAKNCLDELKKIEARHLQEFLLAKNKVKILENLKEKRKEEFKKQELLEESKLLDDFGVSKNKKF